jgi:DHA3 family macrolide efflux protein-like MFS transporter
MGDVMYAIALGFWILQRTGSTALMGALMAATAVPRIFVAPFAGVVVDRVDRRRLLVGMDIMRGSAVMLIGVAALTQTIQVWMAFVAGIIIGLGGAFFMPGVSSVLPSIVPRERLIQANSAYALIATGSGMLGNGAGGFLFQLLGAPLMFLFNGLSYLVSSFTLAFIRLPPIPRTGIRQHFLVDLKEGLRFAWRVNGLRTILITAGFLNFSAIAGFTLVLPLFQKTAGLGPGRYGMTMACLTGGLFSGFLSASQLKIAPARRFKIFMICGLVSSIFAMAFPMIGIFPVMLLFIFLAGFGNAILNSFIPATVQTVVPSGMIGKVSALLMTLSGGLTPLAMAVAGGLAEVVPIRVLITCSFGVVFIGFLPLLAACAFRQFTNFDPAHQKLEGLL